MTSRPARAPLTVLVLALALALGACGGDDKDEGPELYPIIFVNDTEASLTYGLCTATDCETLVSTHDLAAGEIFEVEATVGIPEWYVASDASGAVLGCFQLAFTEPQEGAGFLATDAAPCP